MNRKYFQESNDFLEKIIALLPGHVYWKDRNGVLLGCNDKQAHDVGLSSRHEIVGLTAYDTLPKDLADAITKTDTEVMQNKITMTVEEILVLPSGEKTIWHSQKIPLLDKKNNAIGILGISVDITEIKQAKEKLKATKAKLEGMTVVSASIAHELRTPLASLNIATNGLKNNLPPLITTYKMAKSAGLSVPPISENRLLHLDSTVDSMQHEIHSAFTFLDMHLINLQPTNSSNETFSVASSIQEAIERYPFESDQKALIHLNLENNFHVTGKKTLLIHLFFNLIKNSLHAIASAGKGDITISLEKARNYYQIKFTDTGIGISKEIFPKIFKRFFTNTINGTGIGLTFCKMVMQGFSGKIICKSREGEYTTFLLYFPKKNEN